MIHDSEPIEQHYDSGFASEPRHGPGCPNERLGATVGVEIIQKPIDVPPGQDVSRPLELAESALDPRCVVQELKPEQLRKSFIQPRRNVHTSISIPQQLRRPSPLCDELVGHLVHEDSSHAVRVSVP